MLTLLTPTGGRPQAWARCQRWMARQTYGGAVRWVVVDDGPEPQRVDIQRGGWQIEVLRPEPHWQPGQNTQQRNLRAGLAAIDADAPRVVIIEDDDWYAPDWLSTCDTMLGLADLVGESHARYYNVAQRRAREMGNSAHASLCSTAVQGMALTLLRAAVERHRTAIDLVLWQMARQRGHLFRGGRVVGIKGISGREGIGIGHRSHFGGQPDPQGALLRQWIGVDAEAYL